jgi:hypothetical protein
MHYTAPDVLPRCEHKKPEEVGLPQKLAALFMTLGLV